MKNKVHQYKVELYADGIIKGLYDFKDVPRRLKKEVREALIASGHGDLVD